MATVLMVESWMHSTGECLPPLIRALGHRYVLLTRDPALYPPSPSGGPHPVVRDADEVVLADTNDDAAVMVAALGVASRRRVDGVLTTCDYYLETVATIADRLALPGAAPEVMHTATRKHLVRAALDRAGLANPAFAVASSWEAAVEAAGNLGYPLVAKPVDLNAGTAVQRVDDEATLKDAFWEVTGAERNTRRQLRERVVLLEELLDGPELSVEAVTLNGETTILGITDKSVTAPPAFVESGHMFPAQLPAAVERTVESFVRQALEAVGYTHGLSHTEVMLTADGPRIVEINPRQAGGYLFDLIRLVTGTHPLELLVDISLGHTPPIGTAAAPLITAHPRATSAAIFFVLSPEEGVVQTVDGIERLDQDPDVLRYTLPVPARVQRARSNDAYLGHVLTVDPDGRGARAKAEDAVGGLTLRLRNGASLPPMGVPSGLPAATPVCCSAD